MLFTHLLTRPPGYGKNTRTLLTTEATPKIVIDFCDLPIFDATTYPSVLLVEKHKPSGQEKTKAVTFTTEEQLAHIDETIEAVGFKMPVSALRPEGWNLEQPEILALMEKLRDTGKPLGEYVQGKLYYGIKTGLNEAFVIDEETRKKLISDDPKSKELIKPWLRGRDIKKWKAEWAGLYVIFTRRGTDIDKYPAVKRHLEKFREDLEPKKSDKQTQGRKPGSYKWFEIQDNIAYYKEFERPKISWCHFATSPIFSYDSEKFFSNDKAYILPTDDLCLLAVLNSAVTAFIISKLSPPVRGGFHEMRIIFIEQLPIAAASAAQKTAIIKLVETILSAPDSPDVPRLEAEIDKLVYRLYGLTPEEIAIVEGSSSKLSRKRIN